MKFLIVDDLHPSIFSLMEDRGWEYDYRPEITRDQIREELRGKDALLIRSKTFVDEDLLKNADKLKVVGRSGSGTDNIDTDHLKECGIELFNAPEGNRDAVGDHAVGLMLALLNNIVRSNQEIKQEMEWKREENRGYELNRQVIGLIGFGNTGQAVAARLRAFGCRILVFDKYKEGYSYDGLVEASMDRMFREATMVSLHIPLTEETRQLVNEEFIDGFLNPIRLINTSRGEILDTKALVKGLVKGKVLGAALDVLENEKLSSLTVDQRENFDFLRNSKEVILTPHVAGWTHESHVKLNSVLLDKIERWLKQ